MSSPISSNTKVPTIWVTSIYFFFVLPLLISPVNADCYNPNGTNRNIGASDVASGTEAYFPCNTVQPYSMCCRNTDKCLANGLCQGGAGLWRESCTDQTWRSTACVKLCVSETGRFPPTKNFSSPSFARNGRKFLEK